MVKCLIDPEYAETVENIKRTYGFYHQKYVVMTKKYTKTVRHYYKDKVIESHLKGFYSLAVFAGEKATRFISVDIDAGGKPAVRKVMSTFEHIGIPHDRMYVSTSGKKGYHVDIFFSPWIYNERAKNLYELMIWQSGLDPKKVEFRPTYTQAVKIPLGLHASTRNRCWFLDRDTLEPIESFDAIRDITPIPSDALFPILKEWNKRRWNELYCEMMVNETGQDNSIAKEIVFDEAYYEAKRLQAPGTRHDTMVQIAHDLRTYGANKYQIGKALRGFYYRQDPLYIETAEQFVLEDIDEIAEWAEDNVNVLRQRPSPNEGVGKTWVMDKYDVNAILFAPTDTARRVAFLIYVYCKAFGAAHISYDRIAQDVGCTARTAKKAVGTLVERHIINMERGGCHYRNGMLIRKSNTYFIPGGHIFGCPQGEDVLRDEVQVTEKVTEESLQRIFAKVLCAICSPDYLRRFLTKPEFERMMADVSSEDAVEGT